MKQILTTALAAWLAGNLAAGAADELRVTLKGGGISGTFPVTPTETSCGRLSWDGVPDKDGAMSGGQCEITVQRVDKAVVLKEHTLASDKGIRSDIIAKTLVPTDKVPWTGKISQTTVSVFRVEPDKESAKVGSAIRLESNRDAATIMPRIRAAIEAGPMFEKLSEILSEPDMDIGSGIHIFVYRLSDGTGITVGTPDKKKVMYIEHDGKRLFSSEVPAPPQPTAPTQPARQWKDPGPAGRDQSIAWSMAATFMAAQCFANTYAKAGSSVSPAAGHPGSYDVSFNALNPGRSNDVAIVRVNITIPDKPVSIWLGERPPRATVGFPADAQQESTPPTPRDINGTQTPMGKLGHPIGTYMQVEGVRAEGGKVGVKTLAVEKVNGKKLSQPVSVWIDNVDLLPEGKRCVLAGYESGKWIGTPPDVIKHLGDVAVAQAPWQFRHIFLVISADEPVELSGKFPTKASGVRGDPPTDDKH